MTRELVELSRCDPRSSDEQVVQAAEILVGSLSGLAASLRGKRKIVMKINAGVPKYTLTHGRQTELTDPPVIEGTIRALRGLTDAEIVVGDAPTCEDGWSVYDGLGLPERLGRYPNVRLVDFGRGEFVAMRVPGEPLMFRSYQLHREIAEADAFVSVAKMKAHRAMGCTLCIKNLFGLTPPAVYGYPRNYLHDRLIRLPRVLVDLALLLRPCLNVVDGITAANHGEWGGTPMTPGVLVAGTNIAATDATAARIMGFDPEGDYPDHPFFYRRNAVKLAGESGLGPIGATDIEVRGPEIKSAKVPFEVKRYGGTDADRDRELQRGARCVRLYREHRDDFLERYAGRIVALRDGLALWDAPDIRAHQKKERESGLDFRNGPQLLILVVPEDQEIERLEAYEPYESPITDSCAAREEARIAA